MDETVQICRGFAVAQWKTLHSQLINRDGTNSNDQEAWRCAIEVFERRIRERFLSCIEALEAADSKLDISAPDKAPADCSSLPQRSKAVVPGFAIMALCCLLAETLPSFRCRTEMPHNPEARCSYPDGPCIRVPQTTTGRLDLPQAWPIARGFRPQSLDACVNWCLEGLALHAEWKTDPRFRWNPNGNPLLWILRQLQEELDDHFQGRFK